MAVSMNEPETSSNKGIDDDIEIFGAVLQGMMNRSTENEITTYELLNDLARMNDGVIRSRGKEYNYYPGMVIRPEQGFNHPLNFEHTKMKAD